MVDDTHCLSSGAVHEREADNLRPRHVLPVTVGKMAGEIHLAACIVARLLLGVDVLKLHQHVLVVFESVLFHVERNEDAVDVEHQVVGVHTVEHVVGDGEGNLSLYPVRLAEFTYFIYFVASYHSTFNI